MRRPDSLHEQLRGLADAVGADHDVVGGLDRLLVLAVGAVPACIGVSIVVRHPPPTLTVSALLPCLVATSVLSSLSIDLPHRRAGTAPDALPQLVLYAGVAKAFDAVAPALLALLDLSHRRMTVDGHLTLPDVAAEQTELAEQLDDRTAIAQARGMLLARGLLSEQSDVELVRLASLNKTSVGAAARAVLEAG